MEAGVAISPIAENSDVAVQLAEWFIAEWPEYHRGKTLGDVSSMFRLRDAQTTLIALDGDDLVGTVAVRNSWSDAPEIRTPWIGGLFVKPSHRHRGIGMQLVDAASRWAFDNGHPTIHVAIRDGVGGYLERGWQVVGTMLSGEDSVTVLRLDA